MNEVIGTRIDRGVKRGPRKTPDPTRTATGPRKSVPRRRDEVTGQVQAIPPTLKPREVLDRYLTEQTTSQIAQSYGVTRKSLVAWLREVAPKEWKAVQLIRAHDRKELGNEGIESATDALSLARARETVKSAQWELTSLDPDYQPKQQVTVSNVIVMDSVLEPMADALIDRIRARVAAPAQPNSIIELAPDAVQHISPDTDNSV